MRLIDADVLLRKLQEQQKYSSVNDSRGRAKAIVEVIDAPTIDAQPVKRGKWIICNLYAKCSECSVAYDFDTFQRLTPMNESVPRHCTYCGADMRGDEDEQDQ